MPLRTRSTQYLDEINSCQLSCHRADHRVGPSPHLRSHVAASNRHSSSCQADVGSVPVLEGRNRGGIEHLIRRALEQITRCLPPPRIGNSDGIGTAKPHRSHILCDKMPSGARCPCGADIIGVLQNRASFMRAPSRRSPSGVAVPPHTTMRGSLLKAVPMTGQVREPQFAIRPDLIVPVQRTTPRSRNEAISTTE